MSNQKAYENGQNLHVIMMFSLIVALFVLLGVTLCQSAAFQRNSATTDFLGNAISFPAKSKIECGSVCHRKMNEHGCTAFTLDGISGICTCGKKRYAPVNVTESTSVLHIKTGCNKIKTGWWFKCGLKFANFIHLFACLCKEGVKC